jgi:endonuclease-8
VTVDPTEVGVRLHREISSRERLYVYKRQGLGCRRCGSAIRHAPLANRTVWWCPICQR